MLQKLINLFTISLTIGILLYTGVIMACPEGQVPCGTFSCCRGPSFIIRCAAPFATNTGVECSVNIRRMFVECTIPEFSSIMQLDFQTIPSVEELSEAFSEPCYNIEKCAEKFQCTGCDLSGDLDCPTTSSDISGGK